MSTDLIRYDLLVQDALRSVVRKVLTNTARDGVPGEHHYYVSFLTHAAGVRISNRLRDKYPEEMTIVLQHQFWDLGVTEYAFEVGLAFGGIPERLLVPFDAVSAFYDPSVQFGLKFEVAGGGTEQPANEILPSEVTPVTSITTKQAKAEKLKAVPKAVPTAAVQPEKNQPMEVSETPARKKSTEKSAPAVAKKADKETEPTAEAEPKPSADVVNLDSFRKKS